MKMGIPVFHQNKLIPGETWTASPQGHPGWSRSLSLPGTSGTGVAERPANEAQPRPGVRGHTKRF